MGLPLVSEYTIWQTSAEENCKSQSGSGCICRCCGYLESNHPVGEDTEFMSHELSFSALLRRKSRAVFLNCPLPALRQRNMILSKLRQCSENQKVHEVSVWHHANQRHHQL